MFYHFFVGFSDRFLHFLQCFFFFKFPIFFFFFFFIIQH